MRKPKNPAGPDQIRVPSIRAFLRNVWETKLVERVESWQASLEALREWQPTDSITLLQSLRASVEIVRIEADHVWHEADEQGLATLTPRLRDGVLVVHETGQRMHEAVQFLAGCDSENAPEAVACVRTISRGLHTLHRVLHADTDSRTRRELVTRWVREGILEGTPGYGKTQSRRARRAQRVR